METLLILNGFEISATVQEQESLMLSLAAGEIGRSELNDWLREHVIRRKA
jgi:death-on-curing protein